MTAPTLHSPEDTFPPLPNHTHNPKGYIDAITTRRRAALSNPLRPGTTFAVRLTIPTPGPMSDSANANLRTVPLPAPPCHPEPADYILTLQNPVVGANGVSKYGQLWACSVSLASTADGDGGSVWYQTDRVIAKIVQPSMVYLPHISCWPSEFRSPEILAMKEDIAYKQLAPLQGSTIPYYFGMHQVRTPCQEEAWMLVMEKIEGPTVHEWHEFLPHRLEDDESSLSQAAHATRLEELKNLVRWQVNCVSVQMVSSEASPFVYAVVRTDRFCLRNEAFKRYTILMSYTGIPL
ncbi:hypothetical protein OF83DRAFT_1157557 [Amylostereum chailletii]|nr:hypothetical protein OF83DRAFT_1157557 [Amylostereum chailletii]